MKKKRGPGKKVILIAAALAALVVVCVVVVTLFLPLQSDYEISVKNISDGEFVSNSSEISLKLVSKEPKICWSCPSEFSLQIQINGEKITQKLANQPADVNVDIPVDEEGTYKVQVKLLSGNETLSAVSFDFVYDTTIPAVTRLKEGDKTAIQFNEQINEQINEQGRYKISTNGEPIVLDFTFSEEVDVEFECPVGLSEDCPVTLYKVADAEIKLDPKDLQKDKAVEIPLIITDMAGNKSEVTVELGYDLEGPEIALVSPASYNVKNWTFCSCDYTIQIELNEKGSVSIDGEKLSQNPKTGYFEKTVPLAEGVQTFKVDAEDELGNKSSKTVSVDGICRISSAYGDVHPWCLQRALIACSSMGQGYDPCVASYISSSCGGYH